MKYPQRPSAIASGGVAATPLPTQLRKPTKPMPEEDMDEEERKRRAEALNDRESDGTKVASADEKNWAEKLKPSVLSKYKEARSKGPRGISDAERIHHILNMLDQEEKAPESMGSRLDKMVKPKKKAEDDETEE